MRQLLAREADDGENGARWVFDHGKTANGDVGRWHADLAAQFSDPSSTSVYVFDTT